MNEFVQSIEIPARWKEDLLTRRDQCVLTGWGWNDFPDGTNTWVLNEVEAPIYDRDTCSQYLKDNGVILSNSHLCTLSPGKGICFGDGASPLVCFDKTNEPYLVGIVEFGKEDDCWYGFSVHLRMAKYRKWFAKAIE